MMTAQQFKTTDVLRLEVGAPPATGLVNSIKNPNGHLGAWGWNTPVAQTSMQGNLSNALDLASGTLYVTSDVVATAVVSYGESDRYPVTAGRFASAHLRVQGALAGTTASVRVVFYDAAGVSTGTSAAVTWTSATAAGTIVRTTAIAAPAGTVTYALRVTLTAATTIQRSGVWDRAMLTNAATSGAVTGYAYVDPYTYTNILGGTYEIKVTREGLSAGLLTAAIKDATIDPATSALIRPGNPVRLLAKDAALAVWEPIYSGEVLNGTSKYDKGKARITLNATDNAKRVANIKEPNGVATVPELLALVEGAGTPYLINGSTTQTWLVPTIVAQNANASLLDQVALVRDTVRGYAWIGRWGHLTAYAPGSIPGTTQATLTEGTYNGDIGIDFDTARCVNEVFVKVVGYDAEGKTIETLYGPYRDQTSVEAWGTFSEEFTVQGMAPAAVPGYAAAILAANATPVRKVNELTIPILEGVDFTRTAGSRRVFLDLYDKVTVNNALGGIAAQPLRVSGIEHTITPKKWLMSLRFATTTGVAMPAPAPPVASLGGTTSADLRGARGVSTITYAAATQTQDLNILFPAGSFTSPPVVVVTPTDHRFTVGVVAVSSLSVVVRANYTLGAAGAGFAMQLHWIAVTA